MLSAVNDGMSPEGFGAGRGPPSVATILRRTRRDELRNVANWELASMETVESG